MTNEQMIEKIIEAMEKDVSHLFKVIPLSKTVLLWNENATGDTPEAEEIFHSFLMDRIKNILSNKTNDDLNILYNQIMI